MKSTKFVPIREKLCPLGHSLTGKAAEGTEKIMASLKIGFFSPLFTALFFLLIFFPFCIRYTFTNGSVWNS